MKNKEVNPRELLRQKIAERRMVQNEQILRHLKENGLNILEDVDIFGERVFEHGRSSRFFNQQDFQ
ncbi:MAG: hypothetical protein WCG28_04700 [bacterium]